MPSKRIAAIALAAVVAAAGTFAYAQTYVPDPAIASMTPEQMVALRQDHMKEDGGILRSAGNLTGAEAVAAAETLLQNYTDLTVLFPEGSAVGDSKALPTIWSDNATFQAILASGIEAATAMKAAAEAGDAAAYGAAMQTLGGTCGQCHQQFRS
ncbi:MAG: c-type cytochrome [Devosia sp.]